MQVTIPEGVLATIVAAAIAAIAWQFREVLYLKGAVKRLLKDMDGIGERVNHALESVRSLHRDTGSTQNCDEILATLREIKASLDNPPSMQRSQPPPIGDPVAPSALDTRLNRLDDLADLLRVCVKHLMNGADRFRDPGER